MRAPETLIGYFSGVFQRRDRETSECSNGKWSLWYFATTRTNTRSSSTWRCLGGCQRFRDQEYIWYVRQIDHMFSYQYCS